MGRQKRSYQSSNVREYTPECRKALDDCCKILDMNSQTDQARYDKFSQFVGDMDNAGFGESVLFREGARYWSGPAIVVSSTDIDMVKKATSLPTQTEPIDDSQVAVYPYA